MTVIFGGSNILNIVKGIWIGFTMLKGLMVGVLFVSTSVYGNDVYVFKEGDTLWSLAERYHNNPYDWPAIKELDGSPIQDVYTIPIGHKVLIFPDFAQDVIQKKIHEVPQNTIITQAEKQHIDLGQAQSSQVKRQASSYIYLTKSSGLIRFYYEDRYVVMPVELIIQYFKSQHYTITEKTLNQGVYIDKSLIKTILFQSRDETE